MDDIPWNNIHFLNSLSIEITFFVLQSWYQNIDSIIWNVLRRKKFFF